MTDQAADHRGDLVAKRLVDMEFRPGELPAAEARPPATPAEPATCSRARRA